MSFIRNKQRRLQQDTETSLHDLIEYNGEFYVVTNVEPLELTAIEHYGQDNNRERTS